MPSARMTGRAASPERGSLGGRHFARERGASRRRDRAEQQHDTNKAVETSQKMDELEKKLPEYTALVDELNDVDPNSEDAQAIGSIILKLDELCD